MNVVQIWILGSAFEISRLLVRAQYMDAGRVLVRWVLYLIDGILSRPFRFLCELEKQAERMQVVAQCDIADALPGDAECLVGFDVARRADLVATIYRKLGIDYEKEYISNIGRPFKLAD